ncbi:MAG: zinc ribbon domain-containing protein [Candidatus Sumerlaeota bacterium]|nr:zinc ribbon domain-containing protein [Candidatus Sumerlaeota bacterium]
MPIRFNCPNCQSTLSIAEEHAGKTGKCPKCKGPVTVPAPPPQAPAPFDLSLFQLPTAPPSSDPGPKAPARSPKELARFEVTHGTDRIGPLTADQIAYLVKAGELRPIDMATDMNDISWKPIGEHPLLKKALLEAGPPQAGAAAALHPENGDEPAVAPSEPSTEKRCPRCAKTAGASDRICPSCGTYLVSVPARSAEAILREVAEKALAPNPIPGSADFEGRKTGRRPILLLAVGSVAALAIVGLSQFLKAHAEKAIQREDALDGHPTGGKEGPVPKEEQPPELKEVPFPSTEALAQAVRDYYDQMYTQLAADDTGDDKLAARYANTAAAWREAKLVQAKIDKESSGSARIEMRIVLAGEEISLTASFVKTIGRAKDQEGKAEAASYEWRVSDTDWAPTKAFSARMSQ